MSEPRHGYGDELRTPAPGCPACERKRLHTEAEWDAYHPLRGHGFVKEYGWTKPELANSVSIREMAK